MGRRVRTEGRRSPVTGLDSDVRVLADDHALLLRGVQRRAASVVALAAARAWPYAELDTLTGFLRTAVLPHAIDAPEEPVLILIDALREDHTVQMRVQRLRPGWPAEIHATRDKGLRRVHQRVDGDRDPAIAPAMGHQAVAGASNRV